MLDDAESAFIDTGLNETAEAELCRGILGTVGGGRAPSGLWDPGLPAMRPRVNVGKLEDASVFPGPGLKEAAEVELRRGILSHDRRRRRRHECGTVAVPAFPL
eukprot:scaffold7544_cov107-Isochrysis_galbana.AAC.12